MTTPREKIRDRVRAVKKARSKKSGNGAAPVTELGHGDLKITNMSNIKAESIVVLLPGLLYEGKTTLIAGVPGDGKSLISLDIIARITTGAPWPVGRGKFDAAPVLLLTAEDNPNDTIRPRLDMAGADNEMVGLIEGTTHIAEETGERSLDLVSLTNDLPAIERKIEERRARCLVVDPLTSFADSDTNKTIDMRRLLDGLGQVASRTEAAILIITHMNKRSDARNAMQMIAGSHVIVAAVRAVLVTGRDPNDLTRRLILPIKVNIGPERLGFAFRVEAKKHPTLHDDVPIVVWEKETVDDLLANDVLIDSTPRAQAAVAKSTEVQTWLRELLKDGPVEAKSMRDQAEEMGFSKRRLDGALKAINAQTDKLGFNGKWRWFLPPPKPRKF